MTEIIISHYDFHNTPVHIVKLRGNGNERILNFIYDSPETTGFIVEETCNDIYKLWESIYNGFVTYQEAVCKINCTLDIFVDVLNKNKKGYKYTIKLNND